MPIVVLADERRRRHYKKTVLTNPDLLPDQIFNHEFDNQVGPFLQQFSENLGQGNVASYCFMYEDREKDVKYIWRSESNDFLLELLDVLIMEVKKREKEEL
jgi:menaquinone-dependent protoporphyrinogen IX oxidase